MSVVYILRTDSVSILPACTYIFAKFYSVARDEALQQRLTRLLFPTLSIDLRLRTSGQQSSQREQISVFNLLYCELNFIYFMNLYLKTIKILNGNLSSSGHNVDMMSLLILVRETMSLIILKVFLTYPVFVSDCDFAIRFLF